MTLGAAPSGGALKVFAASVFIFALTLLLSATGQAREEGMLSLRVREQRLTLSAKDTPLRVILEELATATGVVISCRDQPEERVSVDMTGISVEEGLKRLLRHRDTLFIYGEARETPSMVHVLGLHGAAPAETGASTWTAESPEAHGEGDFEATKVADALQLESVEEEIRALVDAGSPAAPSFLKELSSDPQPSVRITALHWMAGRLELPVDGLATALLDSEYLVQSVAMQIMRDYQISDQQIREVMEVAEAGDEVLVRQRLGVLLADPRLH